jgi:hypothetical protein
MEEWNSPLHKTWSQRWRKAVCLITSIILEVISRRMSEKGFIRVIFALDKLHRFWKIFVDNTTDRVVVL